jgi:hypothetical protein
VPPSIAFAGSASSAKGVTASTGTSDATDISARRRYYRGGGGGAAAAAAFAGIVGTGIAIAAARTAETITTAMATTAARRPITADPPTTAAPATMAAVTIARVCPTIAGIPSLAGNLRPPLKPLFKMNPPAAPAGGFFYGCRPGR